MSDADVIRRTTERSIKALTLRPSTGLRTAVSKVRLSEGLRCEIEEGRWKLTADLSEKGGGSGAGPDPGVLGRAALGSCLAMGYVIWAAMRGIELGVVEVEVQADFDVGGQYGVGDAPPGYTEIRYNVTIESDAPEDVLREVIDEAHRNSSYRDVFARAQKLVGNVDIVRPEK